MLEWRVVSIFEPDATWSGSAYKCEEKKLDSVKQNTNKMQTHHSADTACLMYIQFDREFGLRSVPKEGVLGTRSVCTLENITFLKNLIKTKPGALVNMKMIKYE